jgi:hypothetical protein
LWTVSYVEFGKHMTKVYHETILSINDPKKRAKALEPILEFVESMDAVGETGEHGLKSVVSTMQTAKEQFTSLVQDTLVFTCSCTDT